MDPVPVMIRSSPSSEERFWTKLRDRVDTILEQRKPEDHGCGGTGGVESSAGKRLREEEKEEDSLLLLKGFDSASSSLSQLTNTLNAAQQGLSVLVRPFSLRPFSTQVQQKEREEGSDEADEDGQPHAKRHCGPDKLPIKDDGVSSEKNDVPAASGDGCEEAKLIPAVMARSGNLKKAKALAISMASKATTLAKELKMIRSLLCFMQERCSLLEEENKRLRDGVEKGVGAEEDDLVRLQLEALLAEKSRLAYENASLTRENQCLHQLVEYHQLATQEEDPSSPHEYVEAIGGGMRLDFCSSPELEQEGDYENSQEE